MSQDVCCWACRTPYGCGRPTCDHHREFAKQDEADAKARRTYRDPVANTAVNNVMRARKGKGQ